MKILLSTLFVIVFSFAVSGQARKSVVRKKAEGPYLVRLENKPVVKVSVIRINGDKISGLFVSGDTEKITIESDGANISINLAEISALKFGDAPSTVRGNVNFSSSNLDGIGTVPGGVVNSSALDLPKPAYPAAGRAVHATGAVSVQVLINEQGDVISADAISGHPLLRAAAVEAAKQAKFKPTLLDGQPVKVSGIIVYNFVP